MNAKTPIEIAALVAEYVMHKGTVFAGFDYKGKRRNVTIGSNIVGSKGNWGDTFTKGSLVTYKGKLFLQAVENAGKDHHIKRFDLTKAENFVIG